jgi:glycosyltransferase involved in cell wall biosynthesis
MRIVYVLTSLGMGGAEKQALAVAERMAKRGHVVALLVLRPRLPEEWPTAVDTTYLGMRKTPLSVLKGLVRGRRFLRDFRPDLVHSHSFHANIFARLLRLRVPRLVVVSTIHNVYEGGWPRMLAYRLTDGLSRHTVAVSAAAARRFVSLRAVSEPKCLVIPNGVDAAEFACDPERRLRTRSAIGVGQAAANQSFVWLAAGRITPAKDYPNLLRAFAKVRAHRSDARLWIAGEGVGAELARLHELSAQFDLCDSVHWLGLRRDMPALLDAADGFVSASAWEGMPLAVGEAMAMEKPVVATDVGGVHELVGEAGMVVPAGDPEALAESIVATMQQSGEEREQIGRAARERILRQYSVDAAAAAWEALYRELLP